MSAPETLVCVPAPSCPQLRRPPPAPSRLRVLALGDARETSLARAKIVHREWKIPNTKYTCDTGQTRNNVDMYGSSMRAATAEKLWRVRIPRYERARQRVQNYSSRASLLCALERTINKN